jgi:hypothetical protein
VTTPTTTTLSPEPPDGTTVRINGEDGAGIFTRIDEDSEGDRHWWPAGDRTPYTWVEVDELSIDDPVVLVPRLSNAADSQPWHKLHDDAYETAVPEAAGALLGLKAARGETRSIFDCGMTVDDFRAAVAVAFDRGYQTARDEETS